MKKSFIIKVNIKSLLKMLQKAPLRERIYRKTIEKFLKKDINLKRTDKLLQIIIHAAVFELLYKHNNPKK